MKRNFKVGDTVKRIEGEHVGMKIGDTDVITKVNSNISLGLRKYGGANGFASHDIGKFILVNSNILDSYEIY